LLPPPVVVVIVARAEAVPSFSFPSLVAFSSIFFFLSIHFPTRSEDDVKRGKGKEDEEAE
jgi:hypothetical protein